MTDRLKRDLEALLGGSHLGDPAAERQAALAQALAAALDPEAETTVPTPEPAVLAAHIEGALTADERRSLLRDLATSPALRADLDSAAALVELVESTPRRAPQAALTAARKQLERPRPMAAAAPRSRRFSWFALPQVRLGFALASAALIAVLLVRLPGGSPPAAVGPSLGALDAAHFNARSPADSTSSVPPASAAGGAATADANPWAAIAASRSTHATGTATRASTRTEAADSAVAACAKSGANDCTLLFSGRDLCAVAVARGGGAPALVTDRELPREIERALQACQSGGGECRVLDSVCGR